MAYSKHKSNICLRSGNTSIKIPCISMVVALDINQLKGYSCPTHFRNNDRDDCIASHYFIINCVFSILNDITHQFDKMVYYSKIQVCILSVLYNIITNVMWKYLELVMCFTYIAVVMFSSIFLTNLLVKFAL